MHQITIISALLIGLSFPTVALASSPSEKPNFVFIIADDLNDFIGVMNKDIGVKTPNIDKLAAKATLFTNAHSNAPICAPSRASMLSGIYPHRSGQYDFGHWRKNDILKESKTVMEMLSEHGYHTAGTGKVMHHLWPKAWDEYGIRPDYTPLAFNGKKKTQHPDIPAPFGTEVGPLDSTFIPLSQVPTVKGTDKYPGYSGWYYGGFKKPFRYVNDNDRDLLPDEMYANWTVDKIKQFDQQKLNKPFFISTGLIRPHTPLVVPDKYFDLYPITSIKLPNFLQGDDLDTHFESTYGEKGSLGRKHYQLLVASFDSKEQALKHYYQAYLASVSFMDEQVGKILSALEQSSFANNTVVIVTSDHGYNLGEKDNLFKFNLWERSTKVPLIVYDPRQPKGQEINEAVSLIDLYPSFLDYASIPLSTANNQKSSQGKPLDGKSLIPLIDGKESQSRHALTVVKAIGKNAPPSFAIRTQDWRYILYHNGKEELYHHQSDPNEHHNLADDPNYLKQKSVLKGQLVTLTKDAL